MKRYTSIIVFILALLTVSLSAFAQLSQCVISGTVFNVNGNPQAGVKIRLVKVEQAGQVIGGTVDVTTDVDGEWSVTVPASSYAYFCAPTTFVSGMTSNCSSATKKNVPNVASANYSALVTVVQSATQGVVVQDEGVNLAGLITTFDFTGSGVTVTQSATGKASINITSGGGSGTVTSVGLSLPSIFSVSGSPVTTSGTLTGTLATQSANRIFAGPTTGSAAAPTFRALVAADIPDLSGTYQATGNYITALTGDVTASGPGSVAATIANAAVTNAKVAAGIDAAKLADGSVTNAEFQRLDATSSIQTQLDARALASRAINTGAGLSGGGDLSADRTLSLSLDTLVANQTIFDGSQASRTLTFSLSGSTDPVLTLGDGVFNVSTGTIQQGGTAVSLAGHAHSAADITSGTLAIARGGTGTGTAPSDGKLLIGKTDGSYAVANLTAGSNITITNGDGTIQISSAVGNHNLLSSTHSDSTTGTVARGDLITGQGASATWTRLALGPSTNYMRSDGTDAGWSAILAADLPTGIDAAKIADGTVSNSEFQFLDATSSIQTQLDGKANRALSNLASVAINTSLLFASAQDVGSATAPPKDIYLYGGGTFGSHSIKLTGTPTGNVTQTFPNNTGTIANLNLAQTWTAAQTLGSQLLIATSPKVITDISDTNGNELIKFTATGSAVNEITVTNAATGVGPSLAASGETNVPLYLFSKGTGAVAVSNGTFTPTAGVVFHAEKAAFGGREILAKFTVSDGGNSAFFINNGTNNNSTFTPTMAGYVDSANTLASFTVQGVVSAANDASDSSTGGLIVLQAFRSDSATDPINGTLTAVANRKILTVSNVATPLLTVTAGGSIAGLSNGAFAFSNSTSSSSTLDVSLVRLAAGGMRLTNASTGAGNLLVGTSAGAIGTSGAGVLAFTLSTAPSSSPTDTTQLYSNDAAAGAHELYNRNEAGEINRLSGLTARNSAQFDATSSTTLTNVTGLTRNVEASRVYAFRAKLQTTANVAGGVKFAVSGTATATAISYEGILNDTATIVAQTRSTALGTTVCASTTSTAGTCEIGGVIQVNAAGTLTIQFAQNASSASASSVLANQQFQLIPIN